MFCLKGLRTIGPPRFRVQAFRAALNVDSIDIEETDDVPRWQPPLPDFINLHKTKTIHSLTCIQSPPSNSDLVEAFVQLSATRAANMANAAGSDLDEDLEGPSDVTNLNEIARLIEDRAAGLNHDELVLCVKALTCWPEARRKTSWLRSVPTRLEMNIRNIFNILSNECEKRLHTKKCSPETYISITYSNIGNVLELCELWQHIDLINNFKANSFTASAVNRIGDAETNSKSKFRRMEKDAYYRFMKVVQYCQLGPTFHKYYCMIKFLDLLPEMNINEITEICYVFLKKQLLGPTDHPLEVKLRQDIIKKLLEHKNELTSRNLTIICLFIRMGESTLLEDDCLNLQKELERSGVMNELNPVTLMKLASMTGKVKMSSSDGIHFPVIDMMVDKLSLYSDSELAGLSVKNIVDISFLLSFKRDTPRGRLLLVKLMDCLIEHAPDKLQTKESTLFLLYLAKLGLYSHQACDLMFKSPELTEMKDGLRCIARQIMYAQHGFTGAGGFMLALQGLLEIEYPDYSGAKIEGGIDAAFRMWTKNPLPSHPDANPYLGYVKKGLKIYNVLEQLMGGRERVQETYVLPHNSVINYIALIDREGNPCSLPSQFTQLQTLQIKRVDPSLGTWLMITQLRRFFDQQRQARLCGVDGLERIGRKLGFTPVTILWDEVDGLNEEQYRDYVKQCIKRQCNHIKFHLSHIINEHEQN